MVDLGCFMKKPQSGTSAILLALTVSVLSGCSSVGPTGEPCDLANRDVSFSVLVQNSMANTYNACLADKRSDVITEWGVGADKRSSPADADGEGAVINGETERHSARPSHRPSYASILQSSILEPVVGDEPKTDMKSEVEHTLAEDVFRVDRPAPLQILLMAFYLPFLFR